METNYIEYAKAGFLFLEVAVADLACLGIMLMMNKAYEKRKFGKTRLFLLNAKRKDR